MTQKSRSVSIEMGRAWLINSRTIAKKVRNAADKSSAHQIKEYGANRECPNCHYRIDNSDISHEWPGLPVGVKFDPSDMELLEHLAAKCGIGNSKPHAFIDEFIPTLDVENGICYAHPEKLPGAKTDGSSIHFFHRTVNAYASGQRKRRKVHNEDNSNETHVRWHKTGKTKHIIENGLQKGCKKIMVLYKSSKKGIKPDRANWVMHQYHLGNDEDEKGEYVVSKIFYQQQKQADKNDESLNVGSSDMLVLQSTIPSTPNPAPPNPPRAGKSFLCDDGIDDKDLIQCSVKAQKIADEAYPVNSTGVQLEDDIGDPSWLVEESQEIDCSALDCINDSLLSKEIFGSSSNFSNNFGLNNDSCFSIAQNENQLTGNNNPPCGISDLENLELDIAPDFSLADLQFSSQDSILGWTNQL